ncbi:hypothetical protein KAH81_09255 [bacterium]|nr:hypothetical protein [bacterium]
MANLLRKSIKTVHKNDLEYIIAPDGKPLCFKAWLGDWFSFLYDFLMKKTVFPKTLSADISIHNEVLRRELEGIREKRVLELATGNGVTADFLYKNNLYTDIDISPGL